MLQLEISDREFQREERRLLRFTARAAELLRAECGTGRALCLETGQRAVHLSAALLADLDRLLSLPGIPERTLFETLIGWRIKANTDLSASSASPDAACEGHATLVFDAAVAGSLLEKLSAAVKRNGAAARLLRPSSSEALRRDIEQDLAELVHRSGMTEEQVAAQQDRLRWIHQSARSSEQRARVVRPANRDGRRSAGRRRVLHITLALFGLLATVGGVAEIRRILPGTRGAYAEGDLTRDDFRGIRGVVSLEDRPPSVFVVVEQTYWLKLQANERMEFVSNLKQRVDGRGYAGVLVSLPDGEVVGLWRAADGVRIF